MECWKSYKVSAFIEQGSRPIIVVVQVGAVKTYVAAVEGLRNSERQEHKSMIFCTSSHLEWHLFFKVIIEALPCMTTSQGSGAVFSFHYG